MSAANGGMTESEIREMWLAVFVARAGVQSATPDECAAMANYAVAAWSQMLTKLINAQGAGRGT